MKHKIDTSGKSVRLLRVGEEVRHVLAEILGRGDIHDDIITSHSITVTEVRVSPDLRHATAFVQPLGGTDELAVIDALKRHAKYLKGEVGKRLRTKFTPDLVFRLDETFANATHIDALLRSPNIKRDLDA
jgi:ribosome-binding factor A